MIRISLSQTEFEFKAFRRPRFSCELLGDRQIFGSIQGGLLCSVGIGECQFYLFCQACAKSSVIFVGDIDLNLILGGIVADTFKVSCLFFDIE